MALTSHIAELERRHEELKDRIEAELLSPGSDDLEISELKRHKLRLKDEIDRLQTELEDAA